MRAAQRERGGGGAARRGAHLEVIELVLRPRGQPLPGDGARDAVLGDDARRHEHVERVVHAPPHVALLVLVARGQQRARVEHAALARRRRHALARHRLGLGQDFAQHLVGHRRVVGRAPQQHLRGGGGARESERGGGASGERHTETTPSAGRQPHLLPHRLGKILQRKGARRVIALGRVLGERRHAARHGSSCTTLRVRRERWKTEKKSVSQSESRRRGCARNSVCSGEEVAATQRAARGVCLG